MDVILKNIYKQHDDYLVEYTLPFIIIAVLVLLITNLYMKAELLEGGTNWEINKCIPKYMFVSGFVKKRPGENELSSTYNNFKDCVHKYKQTAYEKTAPDQLKGDPLQLFNVKKWFT